MAITDPNPLPELSQEDITRFWSYIDKKGPDECWPWINMATSLGYGRFKYKKLERKATRITYFLTTGKDPGRLFIRHTCDFPPCNNPKHLLLGTQKDNVKDRDDRGRTARGDKSGPRLHPELLLRGDNHHWHKNPRQGEKHPQAILTETQVRAIRREYAKGDTTYSALGTKYGLTKSGIHNIVSRRAWPHVT